MRFCDRIAFFMLKKRQNGVNRLAFIVFRGRNAPQPTLNRTQGEEYPHFAFTHVLMKGIIPIEEIDQSSR